MKKIYVLSFLLIILMGSFSSKAQNKITIRLPITDQIIVEDSIFIVQVDLSSLEPLTIPEKTFAILMRSYKNTDDFEADKAKNIASGRCHLIKGDYYYYFGLKAKALNMKPTAGDLLSFQIDKPSGLTGGPFLEINRQHISFSAVENEMILPPHTFLFPQSKKYEDSIMAVLLADIKYTGKEMMKQQPELNTVLNEGDYKGQKMLDVMINAQTADLIEFLKYVEAKPLKYAGYNWKISEVFATWIFSGAPKVISE